MNVEEKEACLEYWRLLKKKIISWHLFSYPETGHVIIRRQIPWDALNLHIQTVPILKISGPYGSGKTSLIVNFIKHAIQTKFYSNYIWFTLRKKESTEELFFGLKKAGFSISYDSDIAKMNSLIQLLKEENLLLILQNFQTQGQNDRFNDLFELLRNSKDKTRIVILTSQKSLNYTNTLIENIELAGFEEAEVKQLFEEKGIPLNDGELKELKLKTGFMPRGVEIVIDIYRKSQKSISSILSSVLKGNQKYQALNERTLQSLSVTERNLLGHLVFVEGRFGVEIVEWLVKNLKISSTKEFIGMTEGPIIFTSYSDGESWSIPDSLKSHLKNSIDGKMKKETHHSLANYYHSKYQSECIEQPMEIGKQLDYAFRSCKHFQESENYGASALLLQKISFLVKPMGLYEQYRSLALNEIKYNPKRSLWIDFNYCHCSQIIGDYNTCLQYLSSLLITNFKVKQEDPEQINLHLKCTILFAELISDLGYDEYALKILKGCANLYDVNNLEFSTAMQLISMVGWFYLRTKQYPIAQEILEKQISEVKFVNDEWGIAISATRLGILYYRNGNYSTALDYLINSYRTFVGENVHDRRGEAWVSSYIGLSYLHMDEAEKAGEFITKAITIYAELDALDRDHNAILSEYLELIKDKNLLEKIEADLTRVKLKTKDNQITAENTALINSVKEHYSRTTDSLHFNYSGMLLFTNNMHGIQMKSHFVHTYITKAKKSSFNKVITNLYVKYGKEVFFNTPLCNKIISEFSKRDVKVKKAEVVEQWVLPNIDIILKTTDSIKMHYARVLEYANMPEKALHLLATLEDKEHHNYYTLYGNCHKTTNRFISKKSYLAALACPRLTNYDIARIYNNLAELFYTNRWEVMYNDGIDYCLKSIDKRKDKIKWPYPYQYYFLLEIERCTLAETTNVLNEVMTMHKLSSTFICKILPKVWDKKKMIVIRTALNCVD